MSNEATLIAGTIVRFSTDTETPTYTDLKGVTTVGDLGDQSEAKDKTTLADTVKKYGAGMRDPADKNIQGQYMGSDSDQKSFLDACKAQTEMMMQVEYPDKPDATGTGTMAEFLFKPLGFQLDDGTAEDWIMFTVNGKQNSEVTWTDPVAGV